MSSRLYNGFDESGYKRVLLDLGFNGPGSITRSLMGRSVIFLS